ncbi:hypothetical protein [Pseudomonas fluorescens]|nr:hypothetical protein [Pseudomonas fluorescens]
MFSAQKVLDSVKSMQVADAPADLSHCQYLRHGAKLLGFKSYEDLKSYLDNPPMDRIGNICTGLMRKICEIRLPSFDSSYVRMTSYGDLSIGYESYWIGWDRRGREVRVPRAAYGKEAVVDFRNHFKRSLYVIESESELMAWRFNWQSDAVVPVELAQAHFKSIFIKQHLVEKNPPMDLVEKEIQGELKRRGLI